MCVSPLPQLSREASGNPYRPAVMILGPGILSEVGGAGREMWADKRGRGGAGREKGGQDWNALPP